VKLRLLVLFALLAGSAFICPPPSHANYNNPTIDCNDSGGAGTVTTITCAANPPTGSVEIVIVNGYQYTSASIADNSGANTWRSAAPAHIGTSAGYQTYIFYTTIQSSGGMTMTVTYAPASTATFHSVWFLNSTTTGPAFPADALDQAAGSNQAPGSQPTGAFTTNASTQSTSNVTLLANDLIITSIACNSGSQTEFSVTGGVTDLGHSGSTSFHAGYNNTVSAGSQNVTWNDTNVAPCVYSGGLYGVINMAAFKVGSANHGRGPQSWIGRNEERGPVQLRVAFSAVAWRREREAI